MGSIKTVVKWKSSLNVVRISSVTGVTRLKTETQGKRRWTERFRGQYIEADISPMFAIFKPIDMDLVCDALAHKAHDHCVIGQ